jgi:hypothetical protein
LASAEAKLRGRGLGGGGREHLGCDITRFWTVRRRFLRAFEFESEGTGHSRDGGTAHRGNNEEHPPDCEMNGPGLAKEGELGGGEKEDNIRVGWLGGRGEGEIGLGKR